MIKNLSLTFVFTLGFSTALQAETELQQRVQESKVVVKNFMQQLKGELQAAMKAGGPVNAVQVCNSQAPVIADQLSAKQGWNVARTSLKTRNPSNAPDDWERQVLLEFEKRKAKGEDVKAMAYFEVQEQAGAKQLRFMKAIPTAAVCLKCHGDNIAPQVQSKIDSLYPEDKATGFKEGDIRGAFTITRPW